jgi:hypothetical protein
MGAVGPILLLFSLAGGYAFLQLCWLTRYRWETLEWERNLFEAGLVGGLLFIGARLLAAPLASLPALIVARDVVGHAMPFPYAASFAGALSLALLLAGVVNAFHRRDAAIRRAVDRRGGELLILLQDAARYGSPVSLTMANRKVYVGFIVAPPGPEYPYIRILPTISGYRESTSLRVTFDTAYWPVYEDLERRERRGEWVEADADRFAIVLPVEQICSANLFDDEIYRRYFESTVGDAGGSTPGPTAS